MENEDIDIWWMENEDIDIWWKRLWAGFLLLGKRARPTEPQIWVLLGHAVVGEGRQVAKNIQHNAKSTSENI